VTPLSLWRAWTAPTVDGDLARRREAVLLNLLASFIGVAVFAQLTQWINRLSGTHNPQFWFWWPTLLVTTFAFYGLLRLARAGRHRTSAMVLVLVLWALSALLLVDDGVDHPMWALLCAYAVLLSALLLGGRVSTIAAAIASVVVLVVTVLQHSGHVIPLSPADAAVPTDLGGSVGLVLVIGMIAWSCWLYTRDVLSSIDEVLTHGSASSPLSQMRTKSLTVREVEVVQLVAEGLSNVAIGHRLFLSPRTIQSHVANAMTKSGCGNRTELGVLAIREGLVPLTVSEVDPRDAAPNPEPDAAELPPAG
jgi:DNA-binding NarL/FixJ family response regulator